MFNGAEAKRGNFRPRSFLRNLSDPRLGNLLDSSADWTAVASQEINYRSLGGKARDFLSVTSYFATSSGQEILL